MELRKLFAAAGAAAVVSLMASAASASIVYNNGGPNAVNGNETVEWVQSEDFTLGANTALTGAGVYLASERDINTAWDGGFQYYIFDDNSGNPGNVLASGSVSPTVSDSGQPWCCGGDAFLFAFNFNGAFNAAAGTTYHLGIHAGAPGNFNRDEVYWVTTAVNGTGRGVESEGGTFDNWANNGAEHAFYLTSGGVPEPATWALMIGGMGLAGASLRMRRRVLA
jgi:hypothetical protein